MSQLDVDIASSQINALWDESIVPELMEYIRIPNKSPLFDPEWKSHGYMDAAVDLAVQWIESRNLEGTTLEVLQLEGRTPILLLEIPGDRPGNVLMYGHLDKQPEFTGWKEGLGPWTPVYAPDGKLYGRGGADDGYAVFASVAAVEALRAQGLSHPRIVILIECSEESGSPDLPSYIDAYTDRIGAPDLVVCLDSGAGDYERLWATTSLRGVVVGEFRVEVLNDGVHSGDASGVVPSSFRILRHLLSRLEDPATGRVLPAALHVNIPAERMEQAHAAAAVLRESVYAKFPFVDGMEPVSHDVQQLILNRTWRPALSVTGVEGMPEIRTAGNVLRPFTAVKLSMRIPPTLDAACARQAIIDALTTDVPYGAKVSFDGGGAAAGWEAPATAPWLQDAMEAASQRFFGKSMAAMGEGGSIPFMGMLGEKFPNAQFLITGVLGPASNAHGPNEFLHVPFAKRLTGAVADILARVP